MCVFYLVLAVMKSGFNKKLALVEGIFASIVGEIFFYRTRHDRLLETLQLENALTGWSDQKFYIQAFNTVMN